MRSLVLCASLLFTCICSSALAEAPRGDGVRTLYLIRHGEYDHDDPRDATVGRGLVPIGVAQARLLGARLAGMPVKWSSLHTSTLTRARETARILAEELPGLEVQVSPLLAECTPPTWRMDVLAEEKAEDLAACVDQLETAWQSYFKPSPEQDRHDVFAVHGNVIRYFVTRVLGVDTASWLGMSIGNCSLTEIKILPDGSMKLLSFGDVGHLPPNLQTRTSPGEPRDLSVPPG